MGNVCCPLSSDSQTEKKNKPTRNEEQHTKESSNYYNIEQVSRENSLIKNSYAEKFYDKEQLAKTLREESMSSSLNYKCFLCQEEFDLSTMLIMDCKKCLICCTCVLDLLNKAKLELTGLNCLCEIPTQYKKIKEFVLEEDLEDYLREVLKPAFKLPKSFVCIANHLNNLENNTETFASCKKCNENICLRCLEDHDSSLSCLNFYKKNLPKCNVCKERKPNTELSCKCLICNYCNLQDIKDQLEVEPLKNPNCQLCTKIIPDYNLIEIFGRRQSFIRFKEDALIGTKFTCEICTLSKLIDGSITLYCMHRFCKKCISLHIRTQLYYSANAKLISCPKCSTEINYHVITFCLDKAWCEIYERRLLRAMKVESKEVMKFCNVCDYGALIPIDSKEFDCPNCNKKICPNCNNIVSPDCCRPRGISLCDEIKDTLVKCPKCKSGIIKENGCNFIKCLWSDCGGVCFCFLCERILNEEDHYKHFKKTGPFGTSCNTLDRID